MSAMTEPVPPPAARDIVEALHAGVMVIEPQGDSGRISYANPRAARILRRPLDDLIGRRVEEVLAPLDELLREGLPDSETARHEVRLGANAIGFHVSPLPRGPNADDCYIVSFQSISRWVSMREERDRLLQIAAVGQSLPSLLHEIKNPLASISSVVELMLEEPAAEPVREELHAILWEIRRMKMSLDSVGVVGRSLRSHRYEAIDHACAEACRLLASRAEEARVHLRCDVPTMPLLLLDGAVVRAIVHNLVVNAIHACTPGCTIVVHARLVENDRTFELTVVDNGHGMDAATLARCRELFFSTKRSGSGIGLALCQRAVDQAGGKMEIESIPGTGTSIRLIVPLLGPST